MMIMARQASGLTQAEFANKIGLSQTTVSKIEDGFILGIDESTLSTVVKVTGYPPAFFQQPGGQKPLRESFFRKRAALPAKVLKQCEALINITRLELEKLFQRVEADAKLPVPQWAPDEFAGGPREIARHLRVAWGVPRGPISNLISLIEDAGIVVVPFDFGSSKFDGVSIALGNGNHAIFYNSKMPAVRQRMTIAHELGHAIMHRLPTPEMEEEAYAFASELLMPESEIKGALFPLDLDMLLRLKRKWLMSMQAILRWANVIGAVKDSYYKYLYIKIGKAGWRTGEPLDDVIEPEIPQMLNDIVRLHLESLSYTPEQLRQILRANASSFERQYLGLK